MSTILILGVGPVPSPTLTRLYAPGLRLWIFTRTLAAKGHNVIMAEAQFADQPQPEESFHEPEPLVDNAVRVRIPRSPEAAAPVIERLVQQHQPACVVATTDVMNLAASFARISIPRWFDFNGHPMAERQMQAKVFASDEGLLTQWRYVVPALLCGDHFSTCSLAQKYAFIGELGCCGRLNQWTAGHDLVDVIVPGYNEQAPVERKPAVRGTVVAPETFVVLWTGGYNTWVDVDTLFRGLEYAMERSPTVHYVSTGGAIQGQDEQTFQRFQGLVAQSSHGDRYHFCGWVPLTDLQNYYLDADVAINIDIFSYEGLLGARNRLFAWILAELPVVSTTLSEFPRELETRELISTFPIGDARALGELLLRVQHNKEEYVNKAHAAKEFVIEHCAPEILLAPLVNWVNHPQHAPDLLHVATSGTSVRLTSPDNSLARTFLQTLNLGDKIEEQQRRIDELSAELARIRGKRLYRWYKKLFGA
jgi:glycosyltransferase involved in cell wall biosynthesis